MISERNHITDNKLYRDWVKQIHDKHGDEYYALSISNIGDVFYKGPLKYTVKGYDRGWVLMETENTREVKNPHWCSVEKHYSISTANEIASNCLEIKIKLLDL